MERLQGTAMLGKPVQLWIHRDIRSRSQEKLLRDRRQDHL